MVSRILRGKTGFKVRSRLERRVIRFQDKVDPSFCQLVPVCKAFLKLNLNFKKGIKLIRTKVLSKCLWINQLTFKVGVNSTKEWILTQIRLAPICSEASTRHQMPLSNSKRKLCKFINNKILLIWPLTVLKVCLKWNIILTIQEKLFQCYNKIK